MDAKIKSIYEGYFEVFAKDGQARLPSSLHNADSSHLSDNIRHFVTGSSPRAETTSSAKIRNKRASSSIHGVHNDGGVGSYGFLVCNDVIRRIWNTLHE